MVGSCQSEVITEGSGTKTETTGDIFGHSNRFEKGLEIDYS